MSQDTERSQKSDQRTPTFGASAWIQRRRALLQEKEPIVPLRGPDPVRKRATTPSSSGRASISSPRRTSFGNTEYAAKRNSLRQLEPHNTTPSRHVDSDLRQKHYWRENLRAGGYSSQPEVEWCGSTSLPTLNKRTAAFSPPPPIRSIRSPAKNTSTPPREGHQDPSVRLMSLRSIDKHRHQLIAERMEQAKNRSTQNEEETGWKPILAGPRAMPSPPPSPRTQRKVSESSAAGTASATRATSTPRNRGRGCVDTSVAAAPPPSFTPKVEKKMKSPTPKATNEDTNLRKEVERLRMENAMLRAEKLNLQNEVRQPPASANTQPTSPEGESHESPKMSEPKPHSPGRRFQPIADATDSDHIPDIPPDDEKGAAISDSSPTSSPTPPPSIIKQSTPPPQPLDLDNSRRQSVSFSSARRRTNPRPLEAFKFGDSDESGEEQDGPPLTSPAQVAIQSHFAEAAQRRSSIKDPTSPTPTSARRASIVMPNQPTPPDEALVSVDDIQEGIEYSEMLMKRSGSVSTVTRKQSCRSSLTGITGALAVLTESTVSDDDGIQSSRSSSHSDGGDFLVSTTKHIPADMMEDINEDNVDPPAISEIGSIPEAQVQSLPAQPQPPANKSKYDSDTETETESTAVESSTLSSETSSD